MFKELVPSYMRAVSDILVAGIDGEDDVLKCVIELAENCPKVLRSQDLARRTHSLASFPSLIVIVV